jgi:hypothetical protein
MPAGRCGPGRDLPRLHRNCQFRTKSEQNKTEYRYRAALPEATPPNSGTIRDGTLSWPLRLLPGSTYSFGKFRKPVGIFDNVGLGRVPATGAPVMDTANGRGWGLGGKRQISDARCRPQSGVPASSFKKERMKKLQAPSRKGRELGNFRKTFRPSAP